MLYGYYSVPQAYLYLSCRMWRKSCQLARTSKVPPTVAITTLSSLLPPNREGSGVDLPEEGVAATREPTGHRGRGKGELEVLLLVVCGSDFFD